MAANLASLVMPTDDDLALTRARQAWLLKAARMADPREPTLEEVAVAAGLKAGSASVVSLWENNKAVNPPKYQQLVRLAAFYRLPLSVFTEPDETDQERLEALRRVVTGAATVALLDSVATAGEQVPEAGDRPAGTRRRRSGPSGPRLLQPVPDQ